jgi:hypothetical protein
MRLAKCQKLVALELKSQVSQLDPKPTVRMILMVAGGREYSSFVLNTKSWLDHELIPKVSSFMPRGSWFCGHIKPSASTLSILKVF